MKDFIILLLIVIAAIACGFIFLLTTSRYRRASKKLRGTLYLTNVDGQILADFDEAIKDAEDGEIITLKVRKINIS